RKTQEKVREVRQALIERLQNEHNVIIHKSRFLPEKSEPEKKDEKTQGGESSLPGTI
ncbi:hypothetical protein HQ563_17705, partial [bacterium]|nr:hypothetical protein [bacterium]